MWWCCSHVALSGGVRLLALLTYPHTTWVGHSRKSDSTLVSWMEHLMQLVCPAFQDCVLPAAQNSLLYMVPYPCFVCMLSIVKLRISHAFAGPWHGWRICGTSIRHCSTCVSIDQIRGIYSVLTVTVRMDVQPKRTPTDAGEAPRGFCQQYTAAVDHCSFAGHMFILASPLV